MWFVRPLNKYQTGLSGWTRASEFMYLSALKGWKVSGIDFHEAAIHAVKTSLRSARGKAGSILYGDLLNYDLSGLPQDFDWLVSFGVLEHFLRAEVVLAKWKTILRKGGRILTFVPNLRSINGDLLRRFDAGIWAQHVPFDTISLDLIHLRAGLKPIKRCSYCGVYDLDMLVPWSRFYEGSHKLLIRCLRYIGTTISDVLNIFKISGRQRLSPLLFCIYEYV